MQPYVLEKGPNHTLTSKYFEERVLESRKRIYNLALQMLGNRCDAEDVTQETLIRAWSGFAGYDPARSFYAWTSRIATNLCIDRLRRRHRRTEVSLDSCLSTGPDGEEGSLDLADLSQNPERLLLDNEIDEELKQGIRALSAEYRHCVMMLEQEHSYDEIAAKLHCPVGTVRSRIHRARTQLRRVMGR